MRYEAPITEAGVACIYGDRKRLAAALKAARRETRPHVLTDRWGKLRTPRQYTRDCMAHAAYVGWPSAKF